MSHNPDSTIKDNKTYQKNQIEVMRIDSSVKRRHIEDIIIEPSPKELTPSGLSSVEKRSQGNLTYFVDCSAGNDKNTGLSSAKAWKSLENINRMAFAPGDKILFKAGTVYNGRLEPKGSGSKEAPIIIDMFGTGQKPKIDTNGKFHESLLLYNVEYWEVNNLEITNTGNQRAPLRRGVYICIRDFGTADHIHLKGLYVHDVNSSNIKADGGFGIMYSADDAGITKSRFNDLLIEDCHLVRTDRNGIGGWGHWRRSNWLPSLNVVIRKNLLEDIGGDGIVPIACDKCIVERNVLRGGGRRCRDAACGIWPWSCDSTIIQFNEVSGMMSPEDGEAFNSDWNCRNTLIQYNYSHDNPGGFINFCNCGSLEMPHNIGNIGTVARYNISQNDKTRAFQFCGTVKDVTVYNNVVYVGKDCDIWGVHYWTWESGLPRNIQFFNNIFYVEGKVKYNFLDSTGPVFSNNVFYGSHENRPQDDNVIAESPGLMDPGSGQEGLESLGGYMLRNDSPCLTAGKSIVNKSIRDFWGNKVHPYLKSDIGANQLTSN